MPYQAPKGSVRMNRNVDENLHYAFKVAVTSTRSRARVQATYSSCRSCSTNSSRSAPQPL